MPTTTDFCIFDANSGSGNSVIAGNITVQGIDCTGYTGTLTQNAGFTVTINTANTNALKLAAGMTYAPAVSASTGFTFTHTSGTAIITSAGKLMPNITINGAGGTTQQADDLSMTAFATVTLTITSGTYDMNGHALTAYIISGSGATTRGFLLGSSITVGGAVNSGNNIWAFTTTTNLTFTKNSCTITVVSPTSAIATQSLAWGNLTYNAVTINATTTGCTSIFSGSPTFAPLTIGSGNAIELTSGTTTTSSAFTWAGTGIAPISIFPSTEITLATLSCPSGACTLNWGFLYNITASGGATFTATNTLQAGSNPGWVIGPPVDSASSGAAATATAVWQDLLSGSDFSVSSSAGALVKSLSNLQFTVPAIGRGTVGSSPSTTSLTTSAFTPATSASVANQLVGRVVLFDAATTTVALRGQVATISASSASATPTLTVSTLTATPASGDLFSVI